MKNTASRATLEVWLKKTNQGWEVEGYSLEGDGKPLIDFADVAISAVLHHGNGSMVNGSRQEKVSLVVHPIA